MSPIAAPRVGNLRSGRRDTISDATIVTTRTATSAICCPTSSMREETAPLFPGAIGVVVKRAHGNRVATSLSQAMACDAIDAGAREAAGKCTSLKVQPLATPARVRVEATTVALADLFATLPILRRADLLTLEFRAPTMRYAVRVLNSLSAMSFMLR